MNTEKIKEKVWMIGETTLNRIVKVTIMEDGKIKDLSGYQFKRLLGIED